MVKIVSVTGENLPKEGGTNGAELYPAVENISDDHSSCGFSACTWVIPGY